MLETLQTWTMEHREVWERWGGWEEEKGKKKKGKSPACWDVQHAGLVSFLILAGVLFFLSASVLLWVYENP